MSRIILLVFSLSAFNSWACSFAPAFDDFVISKVPSIQASIPNFSVASIHRGTDDGNHGSCSDAGFINLKLDIEPSNEQGYIFEIIKGEFEGQLFHESPVVPSKHLENDKLYSFLWLDGSNIEQEPIDITVKIVAMSRSGDRSEPQFLKVSHPGVIKKPWWKVW